MGVATTGADLARRMMVVLMGVFMAMLVGMVMMMIVSAGMSVIVCAIVMVVLMLVLGSMFMMMGLCSCVGGGKTMHRHLGLCGAPEKLPDLGP